MPPRAMGPAGRNASSVYGDALLPYRDPLTCDELPETVYDAHGRPVSDCVTMPRRPGFGTPNAGLRKMVANKMTRVTLHNGRALLPPRGGGG
eukprot:gene2081-13845_t